MKRTIATLAILVVLALDWAALDDITTGLEPGFVGEYAALIASVPVFGMLWLWLRRNTGGEPKLD